MATLTNQQTASLFEQVAESFNDFSHSYATQRRADALAPLASGRCIEFGGGSGAVTAGLARQADVIHSDIAPAMCRVARNEVGCPSLAFDAERVPFASDTFDTAVTSEMICYLNHPERFIAEAHRILRPGGRLVICATNPMAKLMLAGRSVLRAVGFRRMFFDDGSPKIVPLHSLQAMLQRAGFVVEETRMIIVLPFASLHWLNLLLERTILRHFGLFLIIKTHKRHLPA